VITVPAVAPLAGRVAAVLAEALDRDGATVELRRLSAGASRETFLVRAATGDWSEIFVLQQERTSAGLGVAAMGEQVQLLAAVGRAGTPVPEVVAWDTTGDRLGVPFVLSRFVAGETLPQRILRAAELASARAAFTDQCGRILARLHATSTAGLTWLTGGDQLDQVVGAIDGIGEPHPAFELAIAWLRAHRPPPVPDVVVHGDFRNGNLIVGPDGVRAVLDWELAHLGDPVEDLAWLCLRAWRFRGPGEVGGMGDVDGLLAAYERESGRHVERERFFWWQVLGTLKWGSICQRQARTHLTGQSRSVELAAIGRRVGETEYDLLRMLP
jgi:aminoglycoside phosphotransferase (APT) family kinase protein